MAKWNESLQNESLAQFAMAHVLISSCNLFKSAKFELIKQQSMVAVSAR